MSRATATARSPSSTIAARSAALLGRALGKSESEGFRIAHMGHINAPMILGTLSVVEMGLAALGLRHGKGGAQVATEYLAKAVPA